MLHLKDNAARYIIVNGDLIDTSSDEKAVVSLPYEGTVIYEVIRYIGGKGLFAEDHYKRLTDSADMEHFGKILSLSAYEEYAQVLLSVNAKTDCNIKLLCIRGGGERDTDSAADFVMYLSRTFYPEKSVYQKGVDTALLHLERPDPNAKVSREAYMNTVAAFRTERNVFEAILVNSAGFLTEGSRSNFFYLRKDEPGVLFTAPSELILEGVMRKYTIRLCELAGIPVRYDMIRQDGLEHVAGAFLTGTSIKVLPIATIDHFVYNSSGNPTIIRLMREFDAFINKA